MRKTKYDWKEIQKFYDSGGTWRTIKEEFGCAARSIEKAVNRGDLVLRKKSESAKLYYKEHGVRTLTEETKKKISLGRIKYLEEHPDKVPYLINHSSKKSYPEIIFETALNSNNIGGWTYNYRNGVYSYDFAWTEQKIDVEIDGGTHLSEKVKQIDERRDIFSKSKGWIVLRFTAKEVKDDVTKCISILKKHIDI